MAVAYQIGPVFYQMLRLRSGAPIFEIAPTHEQVEPYRKGKCLIVQYWPGRAVAIGWWTGKHESEESALMAGTEAREVELTDAQGELLERYKARDTIARKAADLDEEWEIVNALDLLEEDFGALECEDEEDDDLTCDCGAEADDLDVVIIDLDEDGDR